MKRLLPVLLATGALLFAACGDDSGSSTATTASGGAATTAGGGAATTAAGGSATTAAGGAAASTNIQKPGECGMGTGQKATGDPIKIGSINTNVPGIDFTWISSMAKAYFDCVNDNGGINGRPIQYIEEDEHIDPAEIAGLAKKLAEQDGVLGFVGNTSIIDCSVNGKYYADNGFFADHRRRRPGLLHRRQLLGREHGPVLLEPRRCAGCAACRREGHDRRHLAQPARHRRHQQRRHRLRGGRTASRASA